MGHTTGFLFSLWNSHKKYISRHFIYQWPFLVACQRLYNSLCRSVGRSVTRLSVGALSSISSELAWTFPAPFYRMNIDSSRMVYVYFHRSIYHWDFSMTVLLKIIYGQDTYSVMYLGVCLTSCLLYHDPGGQASARYERAITAMEMGLAYGWPEGPAMCQ